MKAILIIDMPSGCMLGCKCCVKEIDNCFHCIAKDNRNIQHFYDDYFDGKPNWCSLKELNEETIEELRQAFLDEVIRSMK